MICLFLSRSPTPQSSTPAGAASRSKTGYQQEPREQRLQERSDALSLKGVVRLVWGTVAGSRCGEVTGRDRGDCEVFGSVGHESLDECLGGSSESESSDGDEVSVLDILDGFLHGSEDLAFGAEAVSEREEEVRGIPDELRDVHRGWF